MDIRESSGVRTLQLVMRRCCTLQLVFVLALSLNAFRWNSIHAESLINETLHVALDGHGVKVMWYSDQEESSASADKSREQPECEFSCHRCGVRRPRLESGRKYFYPARAGGFHGLLYEVVLPHVVPESEVRHVKYRCRNKPSAMWSDQNSLLVHGSGISEMGKSAIALLADMGTAHESTDTMLSLNKAYTSQEFGDLSMLVHGGDISYADNYHKTSNWHIWRQYISKLQPFSSQVLYMTGPGNHETQFNFTAYHNWFHMPYKRSRSTSPDYYSFDYLGVHFAMISTEMDFSQGSMQHEWLEADLKRANANRDDVPWVMVVGHRPLYCSSIATILRCVKEAVAYRRNIEDLLRREGVDVYMCGHNHQYERTYPMYKGEPVSFNFTNPTAPVYIVNGGAGNDEGNDVTFLPHTLVPWRAAVGSIHTGWISVVPTRNRLSFFYIESKKHKVVDQFEIIRKR